MKKLTHGMKVCSGVMVLIIVSIVLAAFQMVVAPQNESETAASRADSTVHHVSFSVTDSGFDGPDTLQAGWTELELMNQGGKYPPDCAVSVLRRERHGGFAAPGRSLCPRDSCLVG